MRRGGRTRPQPRGRMARGGRARPAPKGRAMARGGRMPHGGGICGMPGQPPCPGGGGGYRRGGRARPAPKGRAMARGGRTRPVARGRGRSMARGGRPAPRGGRFQAGGGVGTLNASSGLPTPPPCPTGQILGVQGCIEKGLS